MITSSSSSFLLLFEGRGYHFVLFWPEGDWDRFVIDMELSFNILRYLLGRDASWRGFSPCCLGTIITLDVNSSNGTLGCGFGGCGLKRGRRRR